MLRAPSTGLAIALSAFVSDPTTQVQDLSDVLGHPKGRILLVGTFHFDDPGADDYKPKYPFDPTSEQRQHEIAEVVECLARYAPTKVAVEWPWERQAELNDRFARHRRGELALGPSEVEQLGFRLAVRTGLEQVLAVDARGRSFEPYVDPESWATEHGGLVETSWYARYEQGAEWEDALKTRTTLRDYLAYLNGPKRIEAAHGVYLVGTFKVGAGDEYPGVDAKTKWFNRNLRIFANLQRITEREDERIAVVIGSGHLPILRQCVASSPEYALVEATPYLSAAPNGPSLEETISRHTYDITSKDGQLGGLGFDFLLREAKGARFFAVAEPHNTEQVPEFTTLFFRAARDLAGFDHVALEQEPVVLQRLGSAAREGGFDALVEVAKRYAPALHFKSDQELRMIANLATMQGAGANVLWGLDRLLDPSPTLDALRSAVHDETARIAIDELLSKARESGGHSLLVSAEDPFASLRAAVGSQPSAEVGFLLDRLEAARRHLLAQARSARGEPQGYTANVLRETEMRELFARACRESGPSARVLLKLGHEHLVRGRNDGEVESLGSLVSAIAEAGGSRSFHLNVQVINRPGRYWSLTDYPEYEPIARVGSPDAWRVVDLRPLRDLVLSSPASVSPELRAMIFGFDAVLLMGGASRATAALLGG